MSDFATTLDDLHQMTVNMLEMKREVAESLRPAAKRDKHIFPEGVYTTKPPGSYKDSLDYSKQHKVHHYWTTIEGNGHNDWFGFDLCPERFQSNGRTAKEFTLFAHACVAFEEDLGREPASAKEVLDYVAEVPVKLKLIQLKSGNNMAVALSVADPEF